MKVLIIEDDPTLSKNIAEAFASENIHTECVFDGILAERFLKKNFDCIVMDVNLPGKSGFDLCSEFRIYNTSTPVLMLTAFSELEDKVKGYQCGVDDFLTKPFYMRELILRVNALAKRTSAKSSPESKALIVDDIIINLSSKKVTRQGKEISLTPREFQILLKLVERKGELVSKNELIQEIWGNIVDANTNTIEVYINFLRNKIDKPFSKQSIKTKVGYGYYFDSVNEN